MEKVFPENLLRTHHRADLAFLTGEGPYLHSVDGKRYLDFVAGIAVNSLGHRHPHLVNAICSQTDKVLHISNLYRIPEQERLASRICAHSFADAVYFCNSGAESAEGAIKLVRRTHFEAGNPQRTEIITLSGAFHGRTMAALAATGNSSYLKGFAPLPGGFYQIPANDVFALHEAVGNQTAAIMLEPLQSEGGLRLIEPEFISAINDLRNQHGLLVIVDEVQTGIGRTGKLFAHEWTDLQPDVMMLAKGLGGGVPIGAIAVNRRVAERIGPGSHGSTFGGNPLAMAAGNAVLDVVLASGFLEGVRRVSKYAEQAAEKLMSSNPLVFKEFRGRGLLIGFVCGPTNSGLVNSALDHGLLCHTAGNNVLRLLPPLIIDETHVDEAFTVLDVVAKSSAA